MNVAQESSKFGLKTEEVIPLMEKFSQLPHIRVKGLMTIAPFVENPEENRAIFADLHKLYVDIKQKNIDNGTVSILSMGMTMIMKLQSKKEQLWSVSEQESLVPESTISDVRSGMKV